MRGGRRIDRGGLGSGGFCELEEPLHEQVTGDQHGIHQEGRDDRGREGLAGGSAREELIGERERRQKAAELDEEDSHGTRRIRSLTGSMARRVPIVPNVAQDYQEGPW